MNTGYSAEEHAAAVSYFPHQLARESQLTMIVGSSKSLARRDGPSLVLVDMSVTDMLVLRSTRLRCSHNSSHDRLWST